MLYENDVVDAVCDYLKKQGFTIESRCSSTERGDDIVAVRAGIRLFLEAKGEGSAREGTARYGKCFNSGQVFDVVAKAFYRAAVMLQRGPVGCRAGLALPDTPEFRKRVKAIDQTLTRLGFVIFWVTPDRVVTESATLAITNRSGPHVNFHSQ
jgi:hypothetical protein